MALTQNSNEDSLDVVQIETQKLLELIRAKDDPESEECKRKFIDLLKKLKENKRGENKVKSFLSGALFLEVSFLSVIDRLLPH